MAGISEDSNSIALQTLFGVAGLLSVAVALFGLHYRDSLGIVLYRRLRGGPTELYELEAGLQYSDSTMASQTPSTPTASVQELPTNDIPSATPSLSESTPATNQVTTAGSHNTNVETNTA